METATAKNDTYTTANYALGSIIYNANFRCLHNSHDSIYLRHKLSHVLQMLIDNSGRIVTRREIIEEIWEGNQYSGHKGLTHSICKLRQHFKALGEQSVRIVTVPKSGYSIVNVNESSSLFRKSR